MERLTHKARYEAGYKANKNVHDWECIDKLGQLENLEEQGKLLKLPCAVGDTVYYISGKLQKQGRKKVLVSFVVEGTIDNIVLGSVMIPQITVCDNENKWTTFTTFDSIEDIGETVFLTRAEAEEALRKMNRTEEQM